jgi:hypothetical protein
MSSLIASASPWNNDTSDNGTTRKRIPTMRKTVKIRPYARDVVSQSDVSENIEGMANIEETQMNNENHTSKVNDIINQMSNVSADNDGSSLVDFKPPPLPLQHMKNDHPEVAIMSGFDIPEFSNTQTIPSDYHNYHSAYTPTITNSQPYYSKMGSLGNKSESPLSSIYDNRISEKINYMIHLLEGQEAERTANVTEEFILYTFLGVFIIYICDSFSRGGRYIR